MPWVEKAFEEPEHVLSLTVGGNVGHAREGFLLVKELYRADEHLTTKEFFQRKFRTLDCPQGHEDIWRDALIRHIHDSYTFFASNFCWVVAKNGTRTTLKPFVGQAIHRVTLDSQLRAGLPGYMCEVKVRQLGWTLENIARGLHYTLEEDRRALILVDDEDVAAEQATRLGTMLNGLPRFLQPMRRIQNLKHLIFDNPNPKDRAEHAGLNSAIQITVPSSFRGVPPGFVVVSEYAHMDADRQQSVQDGIISAASMTSNSIIIIDTTPNGIDYSYYPMVMQAIEDNPKWVKRLEQWKGELKAQDVLDGILGIPDSVAKGYPTMVPSVCPWRLHEEYDCRSRSNPRGELPPLTKQQHEEMESTLGKLSKYGDEDEIELRDRYGVSLSRLFWRRRKIDRYKMPSQEMALLTFRQEFFGCTIAEAFIDSGKSPFDRSSMDALARQERTPSAIGLFRAEGEFDPHAANLWQQIRIYAPPEADEQYTMGVDTDVAYESPDSDATVAQVVRFRDNKVVCTYQARVASHELIKQLWCIYKFYNNCYYAIEQAGMGYDLIRRCIDRGMGNVHYYKRYDVDYPEPSKYPGWETNRITRGLMDQTFIEVLCHRNPSSGKAEPLINIPDGPTIQEIRGLSRTDTGAFKAPKGRGHDDCYDSLCIALCIALDPYSGLVRRVEKEKEERKQEFNAYFNRGQASRDRNHPSLATL